MLWTHLHRQFVRKSVRTQFCDSTLRSSALYAIPTSQKRLSSYVVKDGRPFRMAVIGSGPAGFYTAYKIMSIIQNAVVDMYEHLPVPFGLVRFGVAPDHPEVKNCQDKFTEVASSPRFNFIGNIDIGCNLSLATLKDHYNAILFAYGASKDRKLGVPGEDIREGIYSARDFVGWYNGYPDNMNLQPDLSTGDRAVIIGQGNVALDVARILLTNVDELRKTDITEEALAALSRSKVKHVNVVGRRGPMQASFTIREVRELIKLPGVSLDPIEPSLLPPLTKQLPRTARRMVSLLKDGSLTQASSRNKSWSLDFMQSPQRFVGQGDPKQLVQIDFLQNQYEEADRHLESHAKVIPVENNPKKQIPTNLAFRSIGYKSVALPAMQDLGIRFDESRGIIPNDSYGRIRYTPTSLDTAGGRSNNDSMLPGLYCAGWVKRGPAGVIANTMEEAFATAEAIAIDWENKKSFLQGGEGWDAIRRDAKLHPVRFVSWQDWLKIDAAEKARGKAMGKEREKFTSVKDMLSPLD